MLKNLLAVLCSLVFVVACADRSGSDLSSELANITPGSQMDLEVNVGDRVFFDFDSATLSADAQATLDRQATWLKNYDSVSVMVEGHCDPRGTREYNLGLGERRAHALRTYLVNAGIDASRVKTISFGKERLAVEGSTEEAYRQDRRGVTVLN